MYNLSGATSGEKDLSKEPHDKVDSSSVVCKKKRKLQDDLDRSPEVDRSHTADKKEADWPAYRSKGETLLQLQPNINVDDDDSTQDIRPPSKPLFIMCLPDSEQEVSKHEVVSTEERVVESSSHKRRHMSIPTTETQRPSGCRSLFRHAPIQDLSALESVPLRLCDSRGATSDLPVQRPYSTGSHSGPQTINMPLATTSRYMHIDTKTSPKSKPRDATDFPENPRAEKPQSGSEGKRIVSAENMKLHNGAPHKKNSSSRELCLSRLPCPPSDSGVDSAHGFGKSRDTFGARPQTFKYKEKVLKKSDRELLPGRDCDDCKQYYRMMGDRSRQDSSRHRCKHAAPSTPPGFWDLNFPDSPPSV